MPGRKKLPTALKVLKGTDQPCRINSLEPKFEKISKAPPAPKWFSKISKKIYRDTSKALINAGVFEAVDLQMLIAYCQSYGLYLEIEERLAGDLGNRLQNIETKFGEKTEVAPLQKISADVLKRSQSLAAEFGMTPASRSKVSASMPNEEDPFTEYMRRGKCLS